MTLDVVHGIAPVRLLLVTTGQQDRRSQVHRFAPEFGQDGTLEPDALHPPGILRDGDRRDHVPADQLDGLGPGRTLTLPLVLVHPEGMPVRAAEFGIDIHERLDEILAGRNIPQTLDRVPEDPVIDDDLFSRHQLIHIDTVEGNPAGTDLESRFPLFEGREHHEYTAGDGPGMRRSGK